MTATPHVVDVTSARVLAADGRVAATIDLVAIGGGEQTVTVDGVPEQRIHASKTAYHVRLLSPDRMIPDELREVDDYRQACDLAVRYAGKLNKTAGQIAELAADLRKV